MGDAIPSGFIDKSLDGNYYLYTTYEFPSDMGAADGLTRVGRAQLGRVPTEGTIDFESGTALLGECYSEKKEQRWSGANAPVVPAPDPELVPKTDDRPRQNKP